MLFWCKIKVQTVVLPSQCAGEKVGVGKICLWCNEKGKSFYATEAVQAHMNDKSHCKLFTEGDAALEFADFYDFRWEMVAADLYYGNSA